MRILKRTIFTLLLALVCPAYGANVSEYSVKASYLSNFADFVKWPKTAFADESSPIVLGVLGEDPFGSTLDEAVTGKTVDGRALAVKRFNNFDQDQLQDLKNCHILFISNSEADNIREILSKLKGTNLLTVSEIERFPMIGGMIQFTQEGDIIGMIINPKTAVAASLKLSSHLLKVAKLYMKVNTAKVRTLYYDGIQLYLNGEIKAAIKKWRECLDEDPGYIAAQEKILKAQEKMKAISGLQ